VAHALGPLLLAGLLALELRQVTAGWGDAASAWPWLGWLVGPVLALGLLVAVMRREASAMPWPFRAEPDAYGAAAGLVLAVSLVAWAMLANVMSNGSARPLPHVPLLNPLDLGIGLALVAAAAWWRRVAKAAWAAPHQKTALWVGGIAAFAWLNGMLIRAFHHLGGVAYRMSAWLDSLAVQTGLALLWTATAMGLMWWSARRRRRGAWLVGAALLGAVVVKLLLVDLSGSGTVTRIVSFIGVGMLMLVIGYVAPLPAKADDTPAGAAP
jgi:uncharacterized membrane protein